MAKEDLKKKAKKHKKEKKKSKEESSSLGESEEQEQERRYNPKSSIVIEDKTATVQVLEESESTINNGNKDLKKKAKKRKKEKKRSKKKESSREEVVLGDGATKPSLEDKTPSPSIEDNDDDDSGSEDLFDAAAQWARMKENEDEDGKEQVEGDEDAGTSTTKTNRRKHPQITIQKSQTFNPATPYNPATISPTSNMDSSSTRKRGSYSLHITNLPYDATKLSIHKAFSAKGCQVTSTRPVFSHHISRKDKEMKSKGTPQGPKNGFTGVAFVDVADEESYKKALEMDKMIWLKEGEEEGNIKGRGWRRRRINVRPTRTREELADIVSLTKERLEKQKEMKKESFNNNQVDGNIHSNSPTMNNGGGQKEDGRGKKRTLNKDDGNENKRKKHKSKGKLTKQERARKAAILQSKRVKKK